MCGLLDYMRTIVSGPTRADSETSTKIIIHFRVYDTIIKKYQAAKV